MFMHMFGWGGKGFGRRANFLLAILAGSEAANEHTHENDFEPNPTFPSSLFFPLRCFITISHHNQDIHLIHLTRVSDRSHFTDRRCPIHFVR